MSTIDDELVSQFLAFTGSADPSSATSYLEMSGGNIEMAVSLYMEHQQGGGSGSGAMDGISGSFDDIRAPDETRTMRLMDDTMIHQDPSFQLMNAMMEEQFAQSAFGSRNIVQDVRAAVNAAAALQNPYLGEEKESMDTDDDEDYDHDDEVQIIQSNPPNLTDMFAPPDHLIHKAGGFQGARTMAKDSKRWLLVNIQRDDEFSCHALNRDVWRDELVENLIREGFIFWQQRDITPEGQTYVERYKVKDYPHVAIIDPRTARLAWSKEGWTQENPLTAELFAEAAMDFCSRNSFDRPPQAFRPGTASLPTKRPMQNMSEDEQLQAAMRASLQDTNTRGDDDSDSHEVLYVDDSNDEDEQADSKPEAKDEKINSIHNELLNMTVGDEPASGARIQIRMPDGKRVVRKFAGSDLVKVIYAFIAQTNEEARGGKEFIAMAGFPPTDLASKMENETIDACGLSGQAVSVRWKN